MLRGTHINFPVLSIYKRVLYSILGKRIYSLHFVPVKENIMRALGITTLTLTLTLLAAPLAAQERSLNFALRGGGSVAPSYPGASDYDVLPDLGLTFGGLRWGSFETGKGIGAVPENGLSLRPALRVLGDRNAQDNPELAGLADRDTAVELGLGLVYQQTDWMAFGELRKGVTGHSAVTGTLGMDAIMRPSSRFTFTAGPRVSFGDSEFASTYFGVSGTEAAASSFDAFEADGGALGAGFEIGARYELNDDWSLDGLLGYEKLIGDAGDSPITSTGSDDQWRLRIGLSREFTLRF